jgi:hypothetical protein
VPLSDQLVAIIQSLPRLKGVSLVFTTTRTTPVSGINRAKRRLHELMTRDLGEEPERWTLHDIRRTCYTGLQRLGLPLEIAEAVTNHRSGTLKGVAKVYARHSYSDEKRRALDAWARHVESIISGEVDRVVPFARRAAP